jgi:hypothetical protein
MKVEELFEEVEVRKDLVGYDGNNKWSMGADHFLCRQMRLTSLKGAPKKVIGWFDCGRNEITSLEGAPEYVGGNFNCNFNTKLTSLHNVHKYIKSIGGHLDAYDCPINSCVLGLLKIKNLRGVILSNKNVENIIIKYLPEGDIIECQAELIEAGLDEYAKL